MQDRFAKDQYYRRNVIGISAVEFFWGMGLPVVVESTFLQLFLKNLGATSLTIGLIPVFLFLGSSIFALMSSYLTSDLAFKRKAVFLFHLISAASILAFGIILYLFGYASNIIAVFFVCYAVFSVCVGMTVPVWLNYLVKIFNEDRSVSGLGYMLIAQNSARLISSFLIAGIVKRYAFSPDAAAVIFICVGGAFAAGSLFFFLTREVPQERIGDHVKSGNFIRHIIDTTTHILQNRKFLFFLGADLEYPVIVTIISFYAAYATTHCHINPAVASGIFMGCIYAGAILSNLFLGTMGYLSMKNKYIFSKIVSAAAALLICFFCEYWSFYAASFFLGVSRGTRMMVYAPAVKRLSGTEDSTAYFAVAPLFTLPFAIGWPLLCGKFLDYFAWLQADAYRIFFITSAALVLITLIFLLKTDFRNRNAAF